MRWRECIRERVIKYMGSIGKQSVNIFSGFGKDTYADEKIRTIITDFKNKYGDSKTEYGIVIDDTGKITSRVGGTKNAVDMVAGKGKLSVHNHPSGSTMFSAKDLTLVGTDAGNGAKGAVIITSNGYAIIQTGANFKWMEFGSKFYNPDFREKWRLASDTQADTWLRNNQQKYGYKYTRVLNKDK